VPESQSEKSLSSGEQKELERRLSSASKENRIPCSSALAIAKSLNIPAREVGKAANKLKIKISKCQLGCF
jgi:LAO/AO transport system kinase